MSKIGSRAMYRKWNRDTNEVNITAVLERYGVPYFSMPPGAGFDLLVFVSPVQLWEVKNDEYKWTLTKSEQARKDYCKAHGIPYLVIENIAQAASAIEKAKRGVK